MFKHDLVEHLNIKSVDTPTGRFYINESGDRFPSVTTFLSSVLDKSGLDEWRAKVGDEEADRTTNRGARRGTALHLVCEKYVMNETLPPMMPSIQMLFNQVKPVLDQLRIGGRCDLVCRFDGKRSILDFKTTNNEKSEDLLYGYFIQETLYACMFEECYGTPITQIVTVSAGDSTPRAQVVIKNRDDYLLDAIDLLKTFYAKTAEYTPVA
jgi:hypothetical protein